mgnify:CR=1 FL=1
MIKLKNLLTNTGPREHFSKKNNILKNSTLGKNFTYLSFGQLNKDKIFYVINRSPGSGLFSNITFVLNHLKICNQFNFIPIIDMENFTTIYNEKSRINKSHNAWEYYFEKLNHYSLSEVYKSKNVIFSEPSIQPNMILDMTKGSFKKLFSKIKIRKSIINEANIFFKKNFNKKDKILGVQLRGSTYKTAAGHAFPPTPEFMINYIKTLVRKHKYNKIFLMTEEQSYLNIIHKEFKDICYFYPGFRMSKYDSFDIYPRKNHRYKLGKETIIETLILSKCNGISFIKSNVISAAILLSLKKQKLHEIFFGYNSRNIYFARWLWYIKSCLPISFGGLKLIRK